MKFWASKVKSGETLKVKPGEGMILHLSQANLGKSKKHTIKKENKESVDLYVNVKGKELVLGTLSSKKVTQQFDLYFEREFELSHDRKSGFVYFLGYKTASPTDYVLLSGDSDSDGYDDRAFLEAADEDGDDSDSKDEDDSDSDEYDSDLKDEVDSEEETPSKDEPRKKKKNRSSDSEPETPAASKKVKASTPQKTDGKKGGAAHVATPHPSKQGGKTPATNPNQRTPKSGGGSHVCKTCSRTFGSEGRLESHTKSKH